MRSKDLILAAIVVLAMTVVLAACGGGGEEGGRDSANAPEAPARTEQASEAEQAAAPEDTTLKLTIPKMARIKDDTIPTTYGTDEQALHDHAAIHLEGTGFPWEKEANVYIAGHRLGFPDTESFLAFYDLDVLENGDEVILTDANGKEYRYEVYEELVVVSTAMYVTEPFDGQNVVSILSCTLLN